ncbi:MAG: glycosyltransferase family 4 protein [Pirellulales bacterium]|nr:glycosyltransferase family 4 protein [Pirellulales bacterium]
MKIAYLGAGAAGRICGACFHDNGLATALRARGEDLLLIPTYTPIRTDEENVSHSRIFFGGVNVYLQQKSALFRHTPWFLDRLLDSPPLLDWLSRRSAGMEAKDLGDLAVSTLQGRDGKQRKEVEKLVSWLERDFRPDIVHLSNILLVGLAEPLAERLGVPILSSLMGEDIFLNGLVEPHASQARELLRAKSRAIAQMVALNDYYADYMSEYLQYPRGKISVIRHGLNLDGYPPVRQRHWNINQAQPVRIGYFARIAVEKGLHQLVEAFALLTGQPDLPPLELHVAGYMSAADQPYFQRITERVAELGLREKFIHQGELDRAAKLRFLSELDLFAEPTIYHESKGISVLEALASGVPAVLPRHGTFPEYIAETGGGSLCEPENPADLAAKLRELLLDPAGASSRGLEAAAAIREKFTADQMALRHQELYHNILGGR